MKLEDESRKVIAATRRVLSNPGYNARVRAAADEPGIGPSIRRVRRVVAADDRIEPTFLASAARQLDRHRLAGLCSGLVYGIDAEDAHLDWSGSIARCVPQVTCAPAVERRRAPRNWIFGAATLTDERRCSAGRLTRRSVLRRVSPRGNRLKHGVCFIPTPLAAGDACRQAYPSPRGRPDRALPAERAHACNRVSPRAPRSSRHGKTQASERRLRIFGAQQAIERGVRTLAVAGLPQTAALGA
ncbi:MAG: hypothetical protein U0556_19465 [Dehalococcoidia bacterium]